MRGRIAALAAALACVSTAGLVAPAAHAGKANCGSKTTAAAFTLWGDSAQYFLASGGSFEPKDAAWTLKGGAAIVAGNEPWNLFGSGSSSLSLPSGATATSPEFCVSTGEDIFRMLVNVPGVRGSLLRVDVTATNKASGVTNTGTLWFDGGVFHAWAATVPLPVPTAYDPNNHETVVIKISSLGAPATFGIDDVAVDPYKNG
jgi:hypothetical protein